MAPRGPMTREGLNESLTSHNPLYPNYNRPGKRRNEKGRGRKSGEGARMESVGG
jgi:hypothetical protein